MEKYNLLIDCSFITEIPSSANSIHLYTGRLLQGLRNSPVFNVTALVGKGMENYLNTLAKYDVDKIIVDLQKSVTHSFAIDRLFSLIPFEKELRVKGIDVVITPYHVICRYFFPKRYRQHYIVHDFFYDKPLQEKLSKWRYQCIRYWRRLLFRNVRYFISISQNTRKELLEYHKDSVVLYNSIPFDFNIQEKPVREIQDKQYILDVNRFQLYKNAETLIRAVCQLRNRIPHILYLKGYNSHPKDLVCLKKIVSDLNMEDRVIFDTSNRSEAEMRWLYTHADLLVSPSLKEGFGWTPIEATILKTPVLISDINVLKEVTCGKIPTFDPYSVEDLTNKMLSILESPPSMEERVALSAFYQEKYSLKKQIDGLTNIILDHIER